MSVVTLTRGYIALVDDRDFTRISKWSWHANVGIQIRAARMELRKMIYLSHQVLDVMPWELDGLEIDHIDGDSLNNCSANLRLVTHTENMRNTARHLNRKGYGFNKRANLWCCYLDEPGKKRRYIGYTKTEEEAIVKVREARYGNNNQNT